MLFIGIFTSEKARIEILEIWRSSEINHSRYPSLHMFLQFTFLGFKMLISNSAIKRARWSTGNEKKRNLYICIFEPRGTPAAPDRERVGVNYHCGSFREGRWFTGWSLRIGCSTRGRRARTHIHTRAHTTRHTGSRHLRQSRLLRYVKAPQPVSSWQFQYGRFQRVSES